MRTAWSASPNQIAQCALLAAAVTFVVAAAALGGIQGFAFVAPRECTVVTWSLLRALPWVIVAALPALVYALVAALGARRLPSATTVGDGPYRQSVLDPRAMRARPRAHLYLGVLLVVVSVALGVMESRRWSCPYVVPASCHPQMKSIVIRGMGTFEPSVVSALVAHFHDCYGLPATAGPPVVPPAGAFDAQRGQWTAERLLAAIPSCHDGDPMCEPNALVIAVTADDVYTEREDWRYAFGTRDSARHVAVFSTAHMTRLGGGTSMEDARKYAARMIAFEYCGLPRTSDPKSVRANSLMGPDDLDSIDEAVW